jgi:hypothetical protein
MSNRAEYQRKWRLTHPANKAKQKENYKRFLARHPDYFHEHNKKWREEHPEEVREYGKAWHKKERARLVNEIHQLLGGKCVKCGYIGIALQIDHVTGGGGKQRKGLLGCSHSSSPTYYKHILKEIKEGSHEYQLLCANHNWEKRYENKEL